MVSFNSGNSYAKFGSYAAQKSTIERLMQQQTDASERTAFIASAPRASSNISPYATYPNNLPLGTRKPAAKTSSPKQTETKFSGRVWTA